MKCRAGRRAKTFVRVDFRSEGIPSGSGRNPACARCAAESGSDLRQQGGERLVVLGDVCVLLRQDPHLRAELLLLRLPGGRLFLQGRGLLLALCSLPRRNATGWKVSGAATQQACVVSGAGNEGFSAGMVCCSRGRGGRRTERLAPVPSVPY